MQADKYEKEGGLKPEKSYTIKQKELVNLNVAGKTSFETLYNYSDPKLLEKTNLKDLIPTKIRLQYGPGSITTVGLQSESEAKLIDFDQFEKSGD